MITTETFVLCLLIESTLTSLITEAIKKILLEYNRTFKSNTLAGVVAVVLSILIGISYVITSNTEVTSSIVVFVAALMIMGWLCAMIGYDKVVQTIRQFTSNSMEE